MTHRAGVRVNFLARREIGAWTCCQVCDRAHVVCDVHDLGRLEHPVAAEGRHLALMRPGVAGTYPELDRLLDLPERAPPQPVIVVEVRVALRAAAARTMAWPAILAEG